MEEEKPKRAVQLTLNNDFIDKVIEQLNMMKTNHNKIIKLTGSDKSTVLVISHVENDLRKKKEEQTEEKKE